MNFGMVFLTPRELSRENARRMIHKLLLDNLGECRFHRGWAEGMMPEIIEKLFGLKEQFIRSLSLTPSRINNRNASIFWESERNVDYVFIFSKKQRDEHNIEDTILEY